MTKKEKIRLIEESLDRYFPSPTIPLEHKNPFTLLIAVLLSAQCTDKAVNKVTPKLFDVADTPEKMAIREAKEVEKIIQTLGLAKTKAKYIVGLSKKLIHDFDGKVPTNFEDLESLPGVGHKTASVVMAQAFSKPAFPVDTHIHRLAKRWGLSNGKNVVQTEKDLKKLFAKSKWNKLHLQIIYFARKFCKAVGHKKELCPLCNKIG